MSIKAILQNKYTKKPSKEDKEPVNCGRCDKKMRKGYADYYWKTDKYYCAHCAEIIARESGLI